MTQQQQPPTVEETRQSTQTKARRLPDVAAAERTLSDVNTSVAVLRTEADRARGLFGFGRRILVPPDEIHVVVGDGRHSLTLSNERKVFGQSADRPAKYWLNPITQVIKLKTISFTVPIHGVNDAGVEALDSSKVSFRLWAHAVAKLNPDKAEIAAQRVGLDTNGLIYTITKVGTAELVAAAATMSLEEIIANRQELAAIAFPKVNQILSELGYDLALLTITSLDGIAYTKLIEQAESRISKETGIATNKEQLAELNDMQAREQQEAEIRAETEKKLAAERLDAQREVETATISQQEALDVRRHEMRILQISREKTAAAAAHDTEMAKVELSQQLGEAEAEKAAHLAQIEAERQAKLRAIQQKREAEINLAKTEAEATRLAVAQAKEIDRMAELTEAEASRLRREELAEAERVREIALVEANKEAEALKLAAEAESRALQIKVDVETQSELVRAEAEATATEKRAKAAKVRAEATKAETAAAGLAEAEVEAARVQVAEKQVSVTRAEGLAQAEVAKAQALVEIEAQEKLALLYGEAPVLVDLERLRLQLTHQERIATIQAETSLKAFEAIAPSLKVHIFGNGGQTGQILANVMALSHGLTQVGEEVPLVGRKLNPGENGADEPLVLANWLPQLRQFAPCLQQVLSDVNPRMLSSLKVADVVERLVPVVAGEESLTSALSNLKADASFRVIGDMPVSPLLRLLGLEQGEVVEDIAVADVEGTAV
ncbi:SPFH domain-containing protein [Candidatus Leptofilum sp.]|uniref:SPFH domain-containing protein n=1 Tax=Candidatus Leptofilum sp. TaxID=3241576 RepID=UPI003B5C1253